MAGELSALPAAAWLVAAALLLLGMALGYTLASLRANRRSADLQARNARLEAELEAAHQRREDLRESFEAARQELDRSFSALASEALEANSNQFLRLAQSALTQKLGEGQYELERAENRVEAMLKPIRETLGRTESEISAMERSRAQAFAALNEQIQRLSSDNATLQREAHNLVQALSRPGVRGRWGELTLKRAVELAGMSAHCDFTEQPQLDGDGARQRPDLLVHMPGNRALVVDAKTPLDAYLEAVAATDSDSRAKALKNHARHLRARITELSGKQYWASLEQSPEFSVLFLPGDPFLAAALEHEPGLLEYALERQVLLATPSTLIALLRTVEYGWQQARLTEHALEIRDLGAELSHRLGTLTEHLARLGRALDQSTEAYNSTIGSLERQVMPAARRFQELGIRSRKTPETPDSLDRRARRPNGQADATAAGAGDPQPD